MSESKLLINLTVQGFLHELASNSPAPGGGSVSALAGGLAAALAGMVARLSGAGADNEAMLRVLERASALEKILLMRVDGDTEAFNRVMQAYRLPKQTAEEKARRSAAIQEALRSAADHPMQVARECLQALDLSRDVVTLGNPNALSDAGVAALVAYSGITGSMFNVAINLEGIKDQAYIEQALKKRDRIMAEAAELYADIRRQLLEKMPYMVRW